MKTLHLKAKIFLLKKTEVYFIILISIFLSFLFIKGVLKEIIKEGSGDERPLTNDKVYVHYVGTLLDGTKFDSSRDRNDKFNFELGKGAVIKAWDIGVATMKRGEICRLICKPEYAYGAGGSGDKIGPNATLIFEIELFDFIGKIFEGKKKEKNFIFIFLI
jgi:hypothetical protein